MENMKVEKISERYVVRRLDKRDVDTIFELCSKNRLYYQYCPPFITKNRVKKRLEKKELPSDSNVYRDIDHIDDETNEPVYFPHPPYMKKEKEKHEFKDIKKIFVKNKNSDSKNMDDKKQK